MLSPTEMKSLNISWNAYRMSARVEMWVQKTCSYQLAALQDLITLLRETTTNN
jgi:hypothetical protein